jgi:hypothetical protein
MPDMRNDYWWKILRLAETSSGEIPWFTSQHVLDRLWQTSRDGPDTATHSACKWVHYACQECGFLLHPGWRGTRIRSSGRDDLYSAAVLKTMRRREQRKRHQAARAKQMRAKDSGGRPVSTKQATADPSILLLESSPKINLLDRNHVVLTCGRCCARYCVKGPGQDVAPKGARPSAIDKKISSHRLVTTVGGSDVAYGDTKAELDGNFVPLPRSNKRIVTGHIKPKESASGAPAATIASLSSPPLTLLERRQQERFGDKKKKHRMVVAPKSELLNFLSSLNDP